MEAEKTAGEQILSQCKQGKKARKKAAIINLIFLTITITTFVSPNRAHTIDFKASDSLFEEQAIVFCICFLLSSDYLGFISLSNHTSKPFAFQWSQNKKHPSSPGISRSEFPGHLGLVEQSFLPVRY